MVKDSGSKEVPSVPLVIFHGLGGWSYLAFSLLPWLMQKHPRRCLVVINIPALEPRQLLCPPSWHMIVDGIRDLLLQVFPHSDLPLQHDVLGHSHGGHVINRWLRYCHNEYPYNVPCPNPQSAYTENQILSGGGSFFAPRRVFLVEVPIFGSTGSGYSCVMITQKAAFKNYALCSNKNGVPWIETVCYSLPEEVDVYIYMSSKDKVSPCDYVHILAKKFWPKVTLVESENNGGHADWAGFNNEAWAELKQVFLEKFV